jgi:thioesterase domain-containing protein
VQPAGPYFIAGWSLGGMVAFEIACQLRESGAAVSYLGMIDAALPENGRLPGNISWMRGLWWAISYPLTKGVTWNYATLRMLANFCGITLPASLRGWRASFQFPRALLSEGWRSLRVFVAIIQGMKSYRPRPFDGVVTLFRTSYTRGPEDVLVDSMRRWCAGLEVHEAPGTHMSLMLDPRQASLFAPDFETTLKPKARQASAT